MIVLANVTAVAVNGRAIQIEGPPGSGKSSLALALIDRGAALIGDDAVIAEMRDGHVWLSPPPNTAGMIEVRGVGIVELPATSAPLSLVLVLDPQAPRYPLDNATRIVLGETIPVLRTRSDDAVQALRAEYALEKHGLPFPPPPGIGEKSAS